MLYARPNYIPKSNTLVIGLPLQREFISIRHQSSPMIDLRYEQDALNIGNRDGSMFHEPLGKPLVWDVKDSTLKARHILRYIFPRQYGLSNPFKFNCPGSAHEYRDFMDREDEIKVRIQNLSPLFSCQKNYQRAMKLSKNANTPKRLKDIVPIIDKMIWRHLKCPYKLLFNKFCPSKVL